MATLDSGVKIIIVPEGNEGTYSEESINPLKGENFRNWMDNYLREEGTFFLLYYNFKNIYSRWRKYYRISTWCSVLLAIIQIVNLCLCVFLNNLDFDHVKWIFSIRDKIIYSSASLGLFITMITLFIVFYTGNIKDHLISKVDEYYGL